MLSIIIATFVAGYLLITLEHPLKINKTSSALLTGILIWVIYALARHDQTELINENLAPS